MPWTMARPLDNCAVNGRRAAQAPSQARLYARSPKRKLAATTLGNAKFLVRALFALLVALSLVQILVFGRWSDSSSPQPAAPITQPSEGGGTHGRTTSSFDEIASDEFRPAQRPWQHESFYQGWPVSQFRPTGQFYVRPSVAPSDPSSSEQRGPTSRGRQPASASAIMTIVTATRNPGEVFFTRTVRFVLEQSLQAFRWVVVNDHSTEASSLRRLAELKQWGEMHEPHRIVIVDSPSSTGPTKQGNGPAAMNYGLRFVGGSPFVAILDDDDMWELTTLEKAALVMSWMPNAYAVSFDVVNHGHKEFMWKRGFHNGDESFFHENNMMQGSPFRSSVLAKCRFREDMADGGADWDFWMCMANHGMWGLHVPESGNWYQWNAPDFRRRRWRAVTTHKAVGQTRARIQRRYPKLTSEDAWPPMVLPPAPSPLGTHTEGAVSGHAPFNNPVGRKGAAMHDRHSGTAGLGHRSALLVLRDLSNDGDGASVRITRELSEAGWRVTVALTHYSDGDESATRRHRQLLQHTHDVFVVGTVAPLNRLPELVAYLIDSRGIGAVVSMPDHSSSQCITRRLVLAAAATLRGGAHRARTPSSDDQYPIAVIDPGPPNAGINCADDEGGEEEEASEDNDCAKVSDARDAVWFALIQPSHDLAQDAQTKQCLMRRGYTSVVTALDEGGERVSSTPSGYASVLEAVVLQQASAARSASARDDRPRNSSTEAWSDFIGGVAKRTGTGRFGDRGMDMRQIQWALQYRKKRFGFGREVQIACPERVFANSRWIDGLEASRACDQGVGSSRVEVLAVSSLRASALRQCGAWCLANLDRRDGDGAALGWEFSGACFRPLPSLDSSPRCRDEISRAMRPIARNL